MEFQKLPLYDSMAHLNESPPCLRGDLDTFDLAMPMHCPQNDKSVAHLRSRNMETRTAAFYHDFIALAAFDQCEVPSGRNTFATKQTDAGHDLVIEAEECEDTKNGEAPLSFDSMHGFEGGESGQLNIGTGIQVIELLNNKDPLLEETIKRDRLENCGDDVPNGNSPELRAKMEYGHDISSGEMCDEDSSMLGLNKKSRVWCSISENKWTLGSIDSITDTEAHITIENQQNQGQLLKLPHSKLLPANPDILEGVLDLIQLSYLNEPSVLHNLRCRYGDDKIYTRAGPVLVAVNPFKAVPLYARDFLESYSCKTKENIEPHVYSTMACAFKAVMEEGVNQSIIISGESGAGKTETAKIAMQFLTAVGGAGNLVNQLLQTNPILEAFGNAKTTRNNNSSRFGKLIDIHLEDSGKICGANIQTYLLEKSRVVLKANNERSYHIFYQLCAGADGALKDAIHLHAAKDYLYLNQSHCLHIENVNDADKFQEVLRAMDDVKITKHEQRGVFALLSAVLWLGNIQFSIIDDENHVHVIDDEALQYVSELLECTKEHLMTALSSWTIYAGNEVIQQQLTYSKAIDSRDALAKAIYSGIFDWLVDRINKSFKVPNFPRRRCISILDIYGFESFLKNSFEQLCINYANERLQQHFNRHLFKLEQEEYTSEGIDWTHIEFVDNQQCLDLFEKWPVGLISLLDEESTFPKASDDTFLDKLKLHLNHNVCFKSERLKSFSIKHYAGEVTYDTAGFLEKNRDVLHTDLLQLLASCRTSLPQIIATAYTVEYGLQKLATPPRRTGVELQKQSISTKFKAQLHKLMQRLDDTEPHFIRCIKPNTSQQSGLFQDELVLQQLQCCGVLEVLRISRAGYPTRILHRKFANRYGFLLFRANTSHDDMLNLCVEILQRFSVPPENYRIGSTKLFLRGGQIGRLEEYRHKILNGIVCFQKLYKGYKARCQYKAFKRAIYFLQSFVRGRKARKLYASKLKEHRAAIVLQSFMRGSVKRKEFLRARNMILLIQLATRHWLKRKQLKDCRIHIREESRGILIAANESSPTKAQRAYPDPIEVDVTLSGRMQTTDRTVRVPRACLLELESRVLSAEAALQEREIENAILQKNLNKYESLWSDYVSEILSLEAMWQMQMTSLQLSLNAAKQSLAVQESSCKALNSDERKPLKRGPNNQFRATRHILPHDDNDNDVDEFEWDEATSTDCTTPEHGTTPRKPSAQAARSLHSSVLSKLTEEFEHRRQVFEDDAEFLVEVKSGQAEATLDPNEELRILKQRFNMWKKDFRYRLRETKCMLQKVGERQKRRRNWWSKRRLQHGHQDQHHNQ